MADQNASAPPPNAGQDEREKSKQIGSLRALWPFLLPYKSRMGAALAALVGTAIISLTLPLAVRRVVDNFEVAEIAVLDQYFLAAIGIAARATAAQFAETPGVWTPKEANILPPTLQEGISPVARAAFSAPGRAARPWGGPGVWFFGKSTCPGSPVTTMRLSRPRRVRTIFI